MKTILTTIGLSGALALMTMGSIAQAEPHRAGSTVYDAASPAFDGVRSEPALQTGRSAYVAARPASGPAAPVNQILGDDVDVGH